MSTLILMKRVSTTAAIYADTQTQKLYVNLCTDRYLTECNENGFIDKYITAGELGDDLGRGFCQATLWD